MLRPGRVTGSFARVRPFPATLDRSDAVFAFTGDPSYLIGPIGFCQIARQTGMPGAGFVAGCTVRIIGDMNSDAPGASIIVPTFQEASNVRCLTERLFAALEKSGRRVELIFVDDDSRDGIEESVEELSRVYPVRLVVRTTERGLSTAVLAGFREAKFDSFVVLDADLQHPPETVPTILDRLDVGDCDFVIASRFVEGASIAEDWPVMRRLASLVARWLAHPVAPLTDPMSGFFALRRSTWERSCPLNPIGYKIALELYVKGRCRQPGEVPLNFAARTAGKSKFGFSEQVRYLRHLTRLYRFRWPWVGWVTCAIAVGSAATLVLLALR